MRAISFSLSVLTLVVMIIGCSSPAQIPEPTPTLTRVPTATPIIDPTVQAMVDKGLAHVKEAEDAGELPYVWVWVDCDLSEIRCLVWTELENMGPLSRHLLHCVKSSEGWSTEILNVRTFIPIALADRNERPELLDVWPAVVDEYSDSNDVCNDYSADVLEAYLSKTDSPTNKEYATYLLMH